MSGLVTSNRVHPSKHRAATDPFPRGRGQLLPSKERASTDPFPLYPRARNQAPGLQASNPQEPQEPGHQEPGEPVTSQQPDRFRPIATPPSFFKWMMRQSLPQVADEDLYDSAAAQAEATTLPKDSALQDESRSLGSRAACQKDLQQGGQQRSGPPHRTWLFTGAALVLIMLASVCYVWLGRS